MANTIVQNRKAAIFDMLDKGMGIMREDKAVNLSDPIFGKLHLTNGDAGDPRKEYVYRTSELPGVDVILAVGDDPLNYSDDRMKVAIVPRVFELNFISSNVRIDMEPSLIKTQLDLSDYRIDFDGSRTYGNDLGAGLPQYPLLHRYRYRANESAYSRFPVDVELTYGDADPTDPNSRRILMSIHISRAYPYLTPEMRKQKREEERLKKREKYGYMNLCTGGVCPETGYWEGWTKESGPTDILRIEKGQKFDAVRTVPLTTDRSSCPMVPGQWMWLCSLEEARGFQWKGFTLNG
ncbi:hypothetical protein [Paraburkholderia tropica]|uniref:hypothetical protein n=1 Tax=Paraburkholderia tropica TaxID=92647 RepID=UPI002AB6E378|nr:hypothetical protein [Paraburkholderia tropica]